MKEPQECETDERQRQPRGPLVRKVDRRAVERVSFADAAEVDLHASAEEADGASLGLQLDMGHADAAERLGEFVRLGDSPLPAVETPRLDQRTGRDVKGSLSLTANFVCPAQKTVQTLLDGHRAGKGRTVQEADLTVITVHRHLALQPVYLIERLMNRRHK